MKNLLKMLRVIAWEYRRTRKGIYSRLRREYVVDWEKNVAYLVNSKAACTSIKVSMYGVDAKDDYSIHFQGNKGVMTNDFFEAPGFFVFSYVRSPFSRLVSCYESKYHFDRKHLGKSKAALDFDYYLGGTMREDRGFRRFIFDVLLIPDKIADRHFCRQYDLLYDKSGKCRFDFIGRTEDMHDYAAIAEKYGFAPLKNYNVCDYGDWEKYYSLLTALIVRLKHGKDIRTFGYEEDFRRAMRSAWKGRRFI